MLENNFYYAEASRPQYFLSKSFLLYYSGVKVVAAEVKDGLAYDVDVDYGEPVALVEFYL